MRLKPIVAVLGLAGLVLGQGWRSLEGGWSADSSYEGRFTDRPHDRYRARNTYSLQVSRFRDETHGRLTQTTTVHDLDNGSRTVKEYEAELILRREGDQVIGEPRSARRRENGANWEDLTRDFSFTAHMEGPNRMAVQVVWQRSEHGRVLDNDSYTLQR